MWRRCSHAPSKTPLASFPKSIPKRARSLQGEVNNWHKGRARIKMRNLRLTFWGLAAMVTLLWLLADLSVFRSSGFFAIRNAAVQYSGVLAIICMSVAMNLAIRPRWPEHWLGGLRSEEQTSELQSLMRLSYAVFCLTKE